MNGEKIMVDKRNVFFSVIIPVYNQINYLTYCIESLETQTFQEFEAILIDDGSTDGSSELCDECVQKYSNIKVVHKKNEGVMYARRTGIQSAQGNYLLFLDSDDKLRKNCLETMKETIAETNCSCVFFNASINENFSDSLFDYQDIIVDLRKEKILEKLCGSHILNSICTKCFSRELFDDCDFEGFNMVTYGEDFFQLLPALDRAVSIAVINQPLYYYRQNQNSVTHRYNRKQIDSLPYVLERLTFYAQKWTDEYNYDYNSLISLYAAQECYTIVKNISFSDMLFKEKICEINRFKKTPIYKKYYKYVACSIAFPRRVLFKILTTFPNIICRVAIKFFD